MNRSNELQFNAIFEEDTDKGYTVYVPELPGCISEGDTFEEARTNIIEAIELYLEDLSDKEKEDLLNRSSNLVLTKVEVNY